MLEESSFKFIGINMQIRKKTGARNQFRSLKTFQLIFSRLMECIRSWRKMLYSIDEIVVCS
jgi:hypothetical protein